MRFFLQLKDSVTKPKFYSTIYNQSFTKTFKYLVLFLLITFIINGAIFSYGFLTGVDKFIVSVRTNMPDFVLANGKLQVEGPQPYILEDDNFRFIIDTTGQTTEASLNNKPTDYILLTENQMVTKQGIRSQAVMFSDIPFEINKDMLLQKLPYIKFVLIIFGIFAFIFGLIGRLFWPLVLSLGALIIDASLNTKLKYSQLYNISVYALTLPIFIELLKNYIIPRFPFFFLLYLGVGLVYVYLALKGIKGNESTEPVNTELNT